MEKTRTVDVVMNNFEKRGVVAPDGWSDRAVTVVTRNDLLDAEISIPVMIKEVIETIFDKDPYDIEQYYPGIRERLVDHIIKQKGTFNSPVWFNFRKDSTRLQGSACYIFDRKDDMADILQKTTYEAQVFHYGSGVGYDLSDIREAESPIAGGGCASGPISFMLPGDAWAKTIKSGGKTRRAAKYIGLFDNHPDSSDFMVYKRDEERKAQALMSADAQYANNGFMNKAYATVAGQTANFSQNTSDEFMQKATGIVTDPMFKLISRCPTSKGKVVGSINASERLDSIAKCAHETGDPGLIFRDTINAANMVIADGEIKSPNPCGEFMGMPDSACNLASLNLVAFLREDGSFDTVAYRCAVRDFIVAMDIICTIGWYPYQEMHDKTQKYRPLGLGFSNLGGLLMRMGLPYDSDEGRAIATTLANKMTTSAWEMSFEIATHIGSNMDYAVYGEDMRRVIKQQSKSLNIANVMPRNSQVTLMAPCGTRGFAMDCDSTGIEPIIAVSSTKTLVTGEKMHTLSSAVLFRLKANGYDLDKAVAHLNKYSTLKGFVLPKEYKLFQCSLDELSPELTLSADGHLLMQAAIQQNISSAISKTINLPTSATWQDIREIYIKAWKLKLKGITVYRNNSKAFQPISTIAKKPEPKPNKEVEISPKRVRPENDLLMYRHRFEVASHKGYLSIGCYQDGSVCEFFITLSNYGSTLTGLLDAWAKQVSLSLQYGVPLESIIHLHTGSIFEPRGITNNSEIPFVTSVVDYVVKFLLEFYTKPGKYINHLVELHYVNIVDDEDVAVDEPALTSMSTPIVQRHQRMETGLCELCGCVTTRQPGLRCFYCTTCGSSPGCS